MDKNTSHETFSTLSSLCTHHIEAQATIHISSHIRACVCVPVLSSASYFPLIFTCSLSGTPASLLSTKTHAQTQNEDYCPVAIHNPLTNCEPGILGRFGCSEAGAVGFQSESVHIDTEPSCSFDAELDDELIGKAPPSPLVTRESLIDTKE